MNQDGMARNGDFQNIVARHGGGPALRDQHRNECSPPPSGIYGLPEAEMKMMTAAEHAAEATKHAAEASKHAAAAIALAQDETQLDAVATADRVIAAMEERATMVAMAASVTAANASALAAGLFNALMPRARAGSLRQRVLSGSALGQGYQFG